MTRAGAMGRPALSLLVKGGRTGLDAYERALVRFASQSHVAVNLCSRCSLSPNLPSIPAYIGNLPATCHSYQKVWYWPPSASYATGLLRAVEMRTRPVKRLSQPAFPLYWRRSARIA